MEPTNDDKDAHSSVVKSELNQPKSTETYAQGSKYNTYERALSGYSLWGRQKAAKFLIKIWNTDIKIEPSQPQSS